MPPGPAFPRLRVVLIEDSTLLGGLLCSMLRELDGVEVVDVAADEAAALRALQTQRPDLAIVDLHLRAGSGLGVLSALRRAPKRFGRPVTVVFSNHAHEHLREHCRALGADRFFDKALQMDELIDYVEAARNAAADD